MYNSAGVKRIQYYVTLDCRRCNRKLEYYASDPREEAICHQINCFESQPFERQNIGEIHISIESSSPFYRITATLIVDHEKRNFIPGNKGAFFGDQYLDRRIVRNEIEELLRKKGSELEKEDFWEGYRFIDDFSKIKNI